MLMALRGVVATSAALFIVTSALAQSQADIAAKINSTLPDNGRGQITAQGLRGLLNAFNSARGQPNGLADLDGEGKIPSARTPSSLSPNTLQILGSGSTGDISAMSARPPASGAVALPIASRFDQSLDARDFGAKDDNSTDNTAAVQAAVNAASDKGRTLRITASANGSGTYRVGPGIDWKNVNLEFEEGAGFANLDGSTYSGSFYSGVGGLPGIMNPQTQKTGRRTRSPNVESVAFSTPQTMKQRFLQYNGTTPFPYAVVGNERWFALLGQSSPSVGSWAGLTNYGNVYNVSNGPGIQMTCSFTQNSQFGTSCSPSPTATNPASNLPYLFGSSIKITGQGVPAGAFVSGFDGGTIAMASGTAATPVGWTAASGTYTVTVTPGRTEFNPVSLSVLPVGTTAAFGPKGGMNWYNQSTTGTNISSDAADQEGYLAGHEFSMRKDVPGLTVDALHNGSYGVTIPSIPSLANTDNHVTYPMIDGLNISGWSGNPATTGAGGQSADATYAAIHGIHVGGQCAGIACKPGQRSRFQVGMKVEDYDVGMVFQAPNTRTFSGNAVVVEPGAGSLVVGDYIVESVSRPPASSTTPCVVGQRAWDAGWEYRCVAANSWKRAQLTAW